MPKSHFADIPCKETPRQPTNRPYDRMPCVQHFVFGHLNLTSKVAIHIPQFPSMKNIHSALTVLSLILGSISCSVTETQPAADAHAPASVKLLVNVNSKGLALEGYDPVAYFTDKKPVRGRPEFTAEHEGATYQFSSAAHRKLFSDRPVGYVPAYGGYCGYAASVGKVRPVKPSLWSVVDGQLILQHSTGAVELWEKDIPGNKARAERFWPQLVQVKAGEKDPVDSLLGPSVLSEAR